MRFSLLTLILVVICLGIGVLVLLRSNAWVPESKAYTEEEVLARFPDLKEEKPLRYSPDGTRIAHRDTGMGGLIEVRGESKRQVLYYFTSRDYSDATDLLLAELPHEIRPSSGERPIHMLSGFLDDDRVMMIHGSLGDPTQPRFRVWYRTFPEWWWGHLYRPEVWALVVVMMMLVAQVVREWKRRAKVAVPAG